MVSGEKVNMYEGPKAYISATCSGERGSSKK
jgi:hypothetical protein